MKSHHLTAQLEARGTHLVLLPLRLSRRVALGQRVGALLISPLQRPVVVRSYCRRDHGGDSYLIRHWRRWI